MGKTKNSVTAKLTEMALSYIGEDPEDTAKLMKWVDRIDIKLLSNRETPFVQS